MNILKEIQNNPRSNKKNLKQALDYLIEKITQDQFVDENCNDYLVLKIDEINFGYIDLLGNFHFQGNFYKKYLNHEKKFNKIETIKNRAKNIKKYFKNQGHNFEEQTAFSLISLGHEVIGISYKNYNKEQDEKIKLALNTLPIQKFEKLSDTDNVDSISADFKGTINNISCKKDSNVVKHPALGSVFAKMLNKQRMDLVNEFTLFNHEGKFSKEEAENLLPKDWKNLFIDLMVEKISTLDDKKVLEIYDFLIGKDRPIILNAKGKHIELINLSSIENPISYTIDVQIRTDGSKRLYIHFDNGVSLHHRIKNAINSESKTSLSKIFKEEWNLVACPNKVIF